MFSRPKKNPQAQKALLSIFTVHKLLNKTEQLSGIMFQLASLYIQCLNGTFLPAAYFKTAKWFTIRVEKTPLIIIFISSKGFPCSSEKTSVMILSSSFGSEIVLVQIVVNYLK